MTHLKDCNPGEVKPKRKGGGRAKCTRIWMPMYRILCVLKVNISSKRKICHLERKQDIDIFRKMYGILAIVLLLWIFSVESASAATTVQKLGKEYFRTAGSISDSNIYEGGIQLGGLLNNGGTAIYNFIAPASFVYESLSVEIFGRENGLALVKNPAPGMVYKNINIWVGTSGFAIPKNIKESTITFRVNKSWLDENSIYEVILYSYSNGTWAALPTEKISEDEKYVYYRASTDHFSPFSIVGVAKTGTLPQPIIKSTPSIQSTEQPNDAVTAVVTSTSESTAPNIELKIILTTMALVGIVTATLLFIRKRRF